MVPSIRLFYLAAEQICGDSRKKLAKDFLGLRH